MWRTGIARILVSVGAAILTVAAAGADAHAAETKSRRPSSQPEPAREVDEPSQARLPESIKAERALARKPNDRAARIQAAKAHLAEGADDSSRIDVAQEHALAVLAEHPADVEALLLAGQTNLLEGNPGGAARYYRAATLADANSATAFLGLGDALTRLGDEPGATAAFARYRELMGMPPLQSAENAD